MNAYKHLPKNDWEAVAEYGRTKYEWLKTFLALPKGIPSHDTFGRLFARLDPLSPKSQSG